METPRPPIYDPHPKIWGSRPPSPRTRMLLKALRLYHCMHVYACILEAFALAPDVCMFVQVRARLYVCAYVRVRFLCGFVTCACVHVCLCGCMCAFICVRWCLI